MKIFLFLFSVINEVNIYNIIFYVLIILESTNVYNQAMGLNSAVATVTVSDAPPLDYDM